MSSSTRGRAGKFSKPKRGGGKHFSRNLRPIDADGVEVSMWADNAKKEEEDSSEETSSQEESSEADDAPSKPQQQELTREERRAAQRAKKQAAIAKAKNRPAAPGDLPSSDDEENDDAGGGSKQNGASSASDDDADMPANPNHTAKARSQLSKTAPDTTTPTPKKSAATPVSQLSRREREALQAQQARERYQKLHAEGKTDEARADLERLKLVRERREAEAARKKAEAEEKAEQEKARKDEVTEREEKMRTAAMSGVGGAKRGGRNKRK